MWFFYHSWNVMVLVRQYITFCTGVVAKLVGNLVIILVHKTTTHWQGEKKLHLVLVLWLLSVLCVVCCVLCVVCCTLFVFIYDNITNCFHRIITDINYDNIVNCFHRIITDIKCHSLSLVSKWFQFYYQCLHITYFWDLISRHAVVYIKIKIRLLGRIET